MNDRLQRANEFVQDAVHESTRHRLSESREAGHRAGFTGAAGIALRRLQEMLDLYKEQMRGPGLSKAEQATYAQLDQLKSEIEAECDRYWRGSHDWRPPKPVAKGIVRRTEETQSEE